MNPSPTCRHLHTDGRQCGSPALRGEPFCFFHHTSRKPMPKRTFGAHAEPQLPAPDDFPAIQRAIGEVLRLLANDALTDRRAGTLLRGLAIASQNLARHHRREEKLAALGLATSPVTDFVNDPKHGTLAPAPKTPASEIEAGCPTQETGCPTFPIAGCPTFATAPSSLRWAGEAETEAPLPDPIPVLTPDPSPTTSYDEAKTIEINRYFQDIFDRRAQKFEQAKSAELEALYDDRYNELQRDFDGRLALQLQTAIQTQAQLNEDFRTSEETLLAFTH